MKRAVSSFICLALLAGLTLFIFKEGRAEPKLPKVTAWEGSAFYRNGPEDAWQDVRKDLVLARGAEVRTDSGASCDVAFDEKGSNIIRIQSSSRAALESIEPPQIRIQEGVVFALVNDLPDGSTFTIASRSATAEAIGTGWSQTADGRLSSFVDSIRVVTPAGRSLDLNEGLSVSVRPNGALDDTAEISGAEKQDWNAWINDLNAKG